MEQRRDTRYEGSQAAWVTVYGEVDVRIPAKIRNISGRGVGLEVGEPVPTGSALKIEVSDSMLLGEAIYCRPEGDHYYVGIELDQALRSLMALSRNLGELAPARLRPETAYALHETGCKNQ